MAPGPSWIASPVKPSRLGARRRRPKTDKQVMPGPEGCLQAPGAARDSSGLFPRGRDDVPAALGPRAIGCDFTRPILSGRADADNSCPRGPGRNLENGPQLPSLLRRGDPDKPINSVPQRPNKGKSECSQAFSIRSNSSNTSSGASPPVTSSAGISATSFTVPDLAERSRLPVTVVPSRATAAGLQLLDDAAADAAAHPGDDDDWCGHWRILSASVISTWLPPAPRPGRGGRQTPAVRPRKVPLSPRPASASRMMRQE